MAPVKSADVVFVVPADVGADVVGVVVDPGTVVGVVDGGESVVGEAVVDTALVDTVLVETAVVERVLAGSAVVATGWVVAVSVEVAPQPAASTITASTTTAGDADVAVNFSRNAIAAATQELQESIEQPGRSRAQSGRLVA